MPGPMPKKATMRQRRNKAATRAVLVAEERPISRRPPLPSRTDEKPWHALAVRWWEDVWASPVVEEFLRADLGALYRLANVVNAYWETGSLQYAAEIRLLEREFGLTPLARRRLEWTVAQADEATSKRERKRAKDAVVPPASDPRGVLDQ